MVLENGGVIIMIDRVKSEEVQGDRRESDGFQKKKYSVDFQLEMDLFLQN
jgi:hypothetical protein